MHTNLPAPKYRLESFSNGSQSVFDSEFGQTMHSTIGPDAEAHAVYIAPSRLTHRLTQTSEESPLILYDIGLGIAANALAALRSFESLNQTQDDKTRDLELISFEIDEQGLHFALEHSDAFPHLQGYQTLLHTLLAQKSVVISTPSGARACWRLLAGDFRETMRSMPVPELIFYDLYSPASCPELWGILSFGLLYKKTESRRRAGLSTVLCTYSASTAARTALLLSGFHVGYGEKTEMKRETTVAATQSKDLLNPLGPKWLDHWKRSSKPLPCDYQSHDLAIEKLTQMVLNNQPF